MMPKITEDNKAAMKKFVRWYNLVKIILRNIISSKIGAIIAGINIKIGVIRVTYIIKAVFYDHREIPKTCSSMITAIACVNQARKTPKTDHKTIPRRFVAFFSLDIFISGLINKRIIIKPMKKLIIFQ